MTATLVRGAHDRQLSLFDTRPNSAQKKPKSPARKNVQEKILDYLARHPGGATNDRLSIDLAIPIQTICPRVHELVACGLVRASDRSGLTRSGKPAKIWTVERKP